ncbi:hypothetical protein RHMOL_Rhmol06G0110500 [Rhododendron molle]|uniref:Uncharacterized protein n=1 Tax=Rhododendron molle TaxID=49168 RepID=A0ACC0NB96_RHOML|nr:hypothetical protein RHMOL_Rhmol06G0110500 [Rhododendron molle]
MMSPDSVTSAMPPNNECVEEEKVWSGDHEDEQEVWSGDREDEQEVWSSPSNKKCGEMDTSGAGKEATENCEDGVEEPSMLESQWQGCGGQQSYTQMMNALDNVEE